MPTWSTEAVSGTDEIRRRGYTHGYAGLSSADNPYPLNSAEYGHWRDAHFEGQCAAIDDGALAPIAN